MFGGFVFAKPPFKWVTEMTEQVECATEDAGMLSNSRDYIRPASEAERIYLESLIREDYERCHPEETLEDMKRRAPFSKDDKGLLRDWMAIAARRAAAARTLVPFGSASRTKSDEEMRAAVTTRQNASPNNDLQQRRVLPLKTAGGYAR